MTAPLSRRLSTSALILGLVGLLGLVALPPSANAAAPAPPASSPAPTPPASSPALTLPSVQEVTDHLNKLYRSKSSHGTVRMGVVTKHYKRELSMEMWSRGEDFGLVVIRSPAREAGTATLMTDKGMWTYAPRADRLMRLPSSLLSESWMGSHFTNDDLMHESSYTTDYTTTLSWGQHDGQRVLVATMIPKAEAAVVYTKVVQKLTAKGWLPLVAEYYDGDDVVRRIWSRDVRDLGGRRVPTKMVVEPTDKPGESTTVTYERMEWDLDVPSSRFTPRGLRREAGRR